MTDSSTGKLGRHYISWRYLPFAALGAIAFSMTSTLPLNYLLRGYLVMLEAQAGLVAIYFLMSALKRIKKRQSDA